MMAEFGGRAALCSVLSDLIDRLAIVEVVDFIGGQKTTTALLSKLKMKLRAVNDFVDDAEEKLIRNSEVRQWLSEVNDTLYAAGELLDEIETEALRQKLEGDGSGKSSTITWVKSNLFRSFDKFKKTTDRKLAGIVERLEFILNPTDMLGLKTQRGLVKFVRSPSIPRPLPVTPSCSSGDDSGVYGRDGDKEAIIKLLLSEDETGERIGVIPIVGMGGIGKTTLAQLVYNDARVKEQFDLISWVCVSVDFDILRITQTIYESITSGTCAITQFYLLQDQLKEALAGKRFLIVLDDVRNEKYDDWVALRCPFNAGAFGSKIIVTTRSGSIADMMGTVASWSPTLLSDEDCFLLVAKHAGNAIVDTPLESISLVITRRSKGLPLAAKLLGCLLQFEFNVQVWEKILRSDIWELWGTSEILPALWLSYSYLPSHLKSCFAYCSIFPIDYRFTKLEVVQLWMAEGLLNPTKTITMEEVGGVYFDSLISRSFFQHSTGTDPSLFIMHDLINDLAKFISGEFCVGLEKYDNTLNIGRKTRHFSYVKSHVTDEKEKLETLKNARYLHTFLSIPHSSCHPGFRMPREVLFDILPTLGCLRVLSLSGYDIEELPESIGKLIQLRQLVLSGSSIKKLPETICTLYNLQTLLLSHCESLVELPSDMGNLINLRHLDIKGTKLRMPSSVGRLKDLQLLSDFYLDKHSWQNIAELKLPNELGGNLGISGCISGR